MRQMIIFLSSKFLIFFLNFTGEAVWVEYSEKGAVEEILIFLETIFLILTNFWNASFEIYISRNYTHYTIVSPGLLQFPGLLEFPGLLHFFEGKT